MQQTIPALARLLHRQLEVLWFRLRNGLAPSFECPICGYRGPFRSVTVATGLRRHAACAHCGSLERHRLQYLVLKKVLADSDLKGKRMLHCAPESFFSPIFSKIFAPYETADPLMPGVDHAVDLTALPFPDASYDVVYASHVLEHIEDDRLAISEIRRVLAPGGVAILPVPIIVEHTIEYPEPNPLEALHVRAPGPDYFDRFDPVFRKIDLLSSNDFPEIHQLFIHEDRTVFPNESAPLRTAMAGEKHVDTVPVCWT